MRKCHLMNKGDNLQLDMSVSKFIGLSILLGLGVFLNAYAYGSFEPVFVSAIFFVIGMMLLVPIYGYPSYECSAFNLAFIVSFLVAGFAAIYANIFSDQVQLYGDAGRFFDYATGREGGRTLAELREVHEGALAIAFWTEIYNLFAALGFERGRYVGVSVNIVSVAMSVAFGTRVVTLVYGHDATKLRLFRLLTASCGLLWMFSAIHLRDAVVLLLVSVLVLLWIRVLCLPGLVVNLVGLVVASFMGSVLLGFLRTEFAFVPLAMALCAAVALLAGQARDGPRSGLYFLTVVGGLCVVGLVLLYGDQIIYRLVQGNESYLGMSGDQHGAGSLGMTLIVKQPLPVRLVLGSLYLIVFPVPVWSGFEVISAIHAFRSFSAIFFYFIIPLVWISLVEIIQDSSRRTPEVLFLVFLSCGMMFAIAATSLEPRHFGAFILPLLTVAVGANVSDPSIRKRYWRATGGVLVAAVVLHVLWAGAKFL